MASPAMRMDWDTVMADMVMTATSLVPPPISAMRVPTGSVTGRSAPIAAAMGSSMRETRPAPAVAAASMTAFFSTPVIPVGTLMTSDGLTRWERPMALFTK